jgi:hypothetical protein
MSDEALTALVDRAISDPAFRARAQEDLDGALAESGLELTAEELEAVRDFQAQAQGMSDDEVADLLATNRRQGAPI